MARLSTRLAQRPRRRGGIGDDISAATTPGLPAGYDPTTGLVFDNTTGATQSLVAPPVMPCLATGSYGPPAPGQVYCDTGTGIAPLANSPSGVSPTTTTLTPQMMTYLAIGGGLLLLLAMGGRR